MYVGYVCNIEAPNSLSNSEIEAINNNDVCCLWLLVFRLSQLISRFLSASRLSRWKSGFKTVAAKWKRWWNSTNTAAVDRWTIMHLLVVMAGQEAVPVAAGWVRPRPAAVTLMVYRQQRGTAGASSRPRRLTLITRITGPDDRTTTGARRRRRIIETSSTTTRRNPPRSRCTCSSCRRPCIASRPTTTPAAAAARSWRSARYRRTAAAVPPRPATTTTTTPSTPARPWRPRSTPGLTTSVHQDCTSSSNVYTSPTSRHPITARPTWWRHRKWRQPISGTPGRSSRHIISPLCCRN